MKFRKMDSIIPGTLALVAAIGCSESANNEDNVVSSGLQLTIDVGAATGVDGIHFEIVAVDCASKTPIAGKTPVTLDKALDDLRIPGGIEGLEGNPLDASSAHAFGDHFVAVSPGCYDVTTAPMTTDLVCHSATKRAVVVVEGKTTEVLLVNQCEGTDASAIDALAVVNHPPVLLDVSFEASKFVSSCQSQVVCATAHDPEGDPLEFVWTSAARSVPSGPVVRNQTPNPDGSVTQCVRYIPQAAGTIPLTVTVYDIAHAGTELTRIEDWLASEGYPSSSHTSLDFMFYATSGRTPVVEICGNTLDDDCDGLTDEDCETITCPPEVSVPAGSAVELTASGTGIAQWSWTVIDGPEGGETSARWSPGPPTTASESFTPIIVGDYEIQVTGGISPSRSLTCTTKVHSLPHGFRVELTWDGTGDVDLHLHNANNTPWFGNSDDCYWERKSVSWGANLDEDKTVGYGPENIRIDVVTPAINSPYTIGVHNFLGGDGRVATVKVYCGSDTTPKEIYTSSPLSSSNDFWKVAQVSFATISSCDTTVVDAYSTEEAARNAF